MCTVHTTGSGTSSHAIRGYISVMITLKFINLVKLKGMCFDKNNRRTSVLGDFFFFV